MAKFIGALDFIIIIFCLDTREPVFADEFAISESDTLELSFFKRTF